MLKSAYKNNKISFICFALSIFLILISFVISCFPRVERIYSSSYYYSSVYNLDLFTIAILISSIISIFLLTKNIDNTRGFKIVSYSIIIAALAQSFLFDLFCEVFAVREYYFSLETLFIFLSDFLTLLTCIFLLIAHLKNFPSYCNIIATGIIMLAFIIKFVFQIIILIDNFYYTTLFSAIFSFAVPLFFIGDLFAKLKTSKNVYSSEIEKQLYALKVKYEIGSITKEEFDKKTAETLNKI